MMKLVVLLSVVACCVAGVRAEEKSVLEKIGSAIKAVTADDSEPSVDAESAKDSTISKLLQEIKGVKEKLSAAGDSASAEVDDLKKKLSELKTSLKAKLEELKAACTNATASVSAKADSNSSTNSLLRQTLDLLKK